MSTLTRYKFDIDSGKPSHPVMVPDPTGQWMKAADVEIQHTADQARIEELERADEIHLQLHDSMRQQLADLTAQLAAQEQQLVDADEAVGHWQAETNRALGQLDASEAQREMFETQAEIYAARAKTAEQRVKALEEALHMLYDHQNGCPLPKYERDWSIAMQRAELLLAPPIAEQDAQLVRALAQEDEYRKHVAQRDATIARLEGWIAFVKRDDNDLGQWRSGGETCVDFYRNCDMALEGKPVPQPLAPPTTAKEKLDGSH